MVRARAGAVVPPPGDTWTRKEQLRDQQGNSTTPIPVMAVDRRKVVVLSAAFMLRLLLICLFPSLPNLLTGRVEVSTPVNSFKRRM